VNNSGNPTEIISGVSWEKNQEALNLGGINQGNRLGTAYDYSLSPRLTDCFVEKYKRDR
jgi:hypothetical protein